MYENFYSYFSSHDTALWPIAPASVQVMDNTPNNTPSSSINFRLPFYCMERNKELPNPEVDSRQEVTAAFCNPCDFPAAVPGNVAEAELWRVGSAAPQPISSPACCCEPLSHDGHLLVTSNSCFHSQWLALDLLHWTGPIHHSGVTASLFPFSPHTYKDLKGLWRLTKL